MVCLKYINIYTIVYSTAGALACKLLNKYVKLKTKVEEELKTFQHQSKSFAINKV